MSVAQALLPSANPLYAPVYLNEHGTAARQALLPAGFADETLLAVSITPLVGTLTITGVAPTVTATTNVYIQPLVGTLTITGQPPHFDLGITPLVGALAVTGAAPIVTVTNNYLITPSVGSPTISGQVPSVSISSGPHSVSPAAGALTATGAAPVITLTTNFYIVPSAGAATITGQAPVVTSGNNYGIALGPGVACQATGITLQLAIGIGTGGIEGIKYAA